MESGASEKVGALYYRWSAAAEEYIVGAEAQKKYRGRGTMLRTRSVPIVPRVAKDESHMGTGEARICAVLVCNLQAIEKLRCHVVWEASMLEQ